MKNNSNGETYFTSLPKFSPQILSKEIEKTPITKAAIPASKEDSSGLKAELAVENTSPESTMIYASDTISFDLSTRGMGFKTINLNKYTDDKENILRIGIEKDHLNFETNFIGNRKPLNFKIQKLTDNSVVGKASHKGISIKKILKINP